MVYFVSNYNKEKETAECYLDLQRESSEKEYKIVFMEPSIIFGDKKAEFLLPNFVLVYRYGFSDEELAHAVIYMKEHMELIEEKLHEGLKKAEINCIKKISEFYGINVYAQDENDTITLEYTSGNEPLTLHMCILDGTFKEEISGEAKYIMHTLNEWYEDMKEALIDMYQSGKYSTLPNWEE